MSIGKITRPGLAFQNVVQNGVATCLLPIGRTIERIMLQLTNITAGATEGTSTLKEIRVRANGKVIYDVRASELFRINAFRGMAQSAGFLSIDFTELTGRDLMDQLIGGFDTSKGIAQLSLECTTLGAAVNPVINAFVTESDIQGNAGGVMSKMLRYPYSAANAGQLPMQIPFGSANGAVVKRIHIVEGVADRVTGVVVKQDSNVIYEAPDALNSAHLVEHGRVPQSGIFSVDFTADRNQRNAWNTRDARSIELLPTFSAADSGVMLVEYYDVLGNL